MHLNILAITWKVHPLFRDVLTWLNNKETPLSGKKKIALTFMKKRGCYR